MAAGSGTVTVRILGDATSLKGALDESDSALGRFSDKMKNVGSKISDVGKKMTLGVTLPIVGIGAVAFEMASDLNESLSKATVVFGDFSDGIVEMGDRAAQTMGMSKQAAIEAASTFGNLFRTIGLGKPEAAKMSESLVGLAADLASFNNLDPAEVLEKLKSGLVGEAEPMRSLGVQLTEATVKAKALEMGLGDAHGELTEGEKVQARYALILEQTKTAQGDFARTADGAANQQRILKAEFADTAATIGQKLMPIGMKLLEWVGKLATFFTNLSPKMQNIILVVAGLAAAAGPLTTIIGGLITGIGALLTPVGAAILLFAVIAGAFIYAYTQVDGFRTAVDACAQVALAFVDVIRSMLQPVIDFLAEHTEELKVVLTALAVLVGGAVLAAMVSFGITIAAAALAITAAALVVLGIIQAFQWLWEKTEGIRGFLADVFTPVLDHLTGVVEAVRDAAKDLADKINGPLFTAFGVLWAAAQMVTDKLEGPLFNAFRTIWAVTRMVGDQFLWLAQDVLGGLISAIQTVIDLAGRAIDLVSKIPTPGGLPFGLPTPGDLPFGLPGLPGFAGGGVMPGAIGQAGLAILHGGERVLTPGQQANGGHVTFAPTINVSSLDPAGAARAVGEALREFVRSYPVPDALKQAFAN